MRAQLFDKRVYATLTYFNITQNNFSIPNQANATVPPPAIPFPPIFTDRRDKGIEFETTSAITDQVSIVGNFSYEHDRTPLGQVFRGVADASAAAFLNYTFDKAGSFKGLSAGIGVDYLGKRAGDNPSGTPTASSTPRPPHPAAALVLAAGAHAGRPDGQLPASTTTGAPSSTSTTCSTRPTTRPAPRATTSSWHPDQPAGDVGVQVLGGRGWA